MQPLTFAAAQHILAKYISRNHESLHTLTEEYKMFKKLIVWLKMPSLQREIDAFIASKHPTNTAEVEYWVNQYLFARGAL